MLRRLSILLVFPFFIVCLPSCSPQTKNLSDKICFANGCIHVEVAESPEERAKGFQGRRQLDKDKGMLFIFPKNDKHSFWMKDTLIALDMVWIDQNKRIVTIMPGILPCQTEQCPG